MRGGRGPAPREGCPPLLLSPTSSATPKLEEMEASRMVELLSSCGGRERTVISCWQMSPSSVEMLRNFCRVCMVVFV